MIFCNVLKTGFEHNWFPLYAFKYSFLRRGPKVSPDSQRVPIGPRYDLHISLVSYIALLKRYRPCTKSTIRYIHSTKAATVLPIYRHHRLCWQFARSDTANVPRHLNVRKCGLSNNIYTQLHTPGSSTDSLVINITHPHLVILHNEKQWSRKGGDEVGYSSTHDTRH